MQILSNDRLIIAVKEHGAELCSIVSKDSGKEYLWQANPEYWKRHSPVLFPIVGSVWDSKFRVDDKEYVMSQHGFARDTDFVLVSNTDDELWYIIKSDDNTMKAYPFMFELMVGYKLHGDIIDVMWRVRNTGTAEMHFQIGAHPAFYYPYYGADTDGRGFFCFDNSEPLVCRPIVQKGCVGDDTFTLTLDSDGLLPVDTHTFDNDALIFENSQMHRVTLLDLEKKPYLSLSFPTPLVALWSPPAKDAPFVCIEPWYGRTDRVSYDGEYKDKDWMQHLQAGEEFAGGYSIEISL